MPKKTTQIALAEEDPIDVWVEFQSTDNGEDSRPTILPSKSSIKKIKERNPDYMPGKVKHYTEQEIQEYEEHARK